MSATFETKIVVIDDDPTGCQTVHSCLLLTRWDPTTLIEALTDDSPLLFVLANTRAMGSAEAAAVTREVCVNLRDALARLESAGRTIRLLLVSRSDSTLRGHYPVETDVIEQELGPFDAHFLVPAFFEGGRITRDGTHYLMVDGALVPVNETEFARDSVFGFRHAFLPNYVEEKTQGRIPAAEVERFGLADIHGDLAARLTELAGNRCCVVDAEAPSDLDAFARHVKTAVGAGKRFLFRSAASLLTSLAGLPPQPVPADAMFRYARRGRAGVVLIGSHVAKSTRQLERLIERSDVIPIEVDLSRLERDDEGLLSELSGRIGQAQRENRAVALFTSRGERRFQTPQARLAFGERVSDLLVRIVRNLPPEIGFLISKGGITSNDTLSKGLSLRSSRVLGQVHPGCPVVRCPGDHPRFPDLPVVIFPGNVGDDEALVRVFTAMNRTD